MLLPHRFVRSIVYAFVTAVAFVAAPLSTLADCGSQWLPGSGVPGVDGDVHAIVLWDPDGPGPLPARFTVGGRINFPDGTASGVAYWSGSAWVRIPGVPAPIEALLPLPDGRLLVGGSFNSINQQAGTAPIASWDGSSWTPLGATNDVHITTVRVLNRFPNGDIVAGGDSTSNVTHTGRGIARWNGSAWSPIGGAGIPSSKNVNLLTFLTNGDLIAAGSFSTIDGITVNGIARWNGSVWSSMAGGFSNFGAARGLVAADNGDLLVGGTFDKVGGVSTSKIARWNGSAWSAFSPTVIPFGINAMVGLPGGQLVITAGFGSTIASKWNGTSWSPIATSWAAEPDLSSGGSIKTLVALPDGRIAIGGVFEGFDNTAAVNVAAYEAGAWSAFGTGNDSAPRVFITLADGRLVAGGSFRSIAGVAANSIAVFNGATWAPLGSGIQGTVRSLAQLPDGRLVVGGSFTSAGGAAANSLAIWDGSAWAALGSGIAKFEAVRALLYAPDSKLYIAGTFSSIGGVTAAKIASWDGSNFAPLGTGCDANVNALAWYSNKLIAAGDFIAAGGVAAARHVGAWNGSAWSGLGAGITGPPDVFQNVSCLLAASDGTLFVGGSFDQSNVSYGLAKWNGSSWSSEWTSGATQVVTLIELPNGDIVAGGVMSNVGPVPVSGIARRDHLTGTWSSVSGGITAPFNSVIQLGAYGTGFFVSGPFYRAGGLLSARLAFYTDDATPQVGSSPAPVNADKGDTVVLSAITAPGYSASSFQWQRETAPMSGVFANVSNGPGGSSPAGGNVSGAFGSLASPTNTTPLVLSITSARPADTARYRVVVTGDCGSGASLAAEVTVLDSCPSDINVDGLVDDADFVLFAADYNILDCSDPTMPAGCPSDMNGDNVVDDGDFIIFAAAYEALLCP